MHNQIEDRNDYGKSRGIPLDVLPSAEISSVLGNKVSDPNKNKKSSREKELFRKRKYYQRNEVKIRKQQKQYYSQCTQDRSKEKPQSLRTQALKTLGDLQYVTPIASQMLGNCKNISHAAQPCEVFPKAIRSPSSGELIHQDKTDTKEHGLIRKSQFYPGNSAEEQGDNDHQLDRNQMYDGECAINATEGTPCVSTNHPDSLDKNSLVQNSIQTRPKFIENSSKDLAKIKASRRIVMEYRKFRQNRMKNIAIEQAIAIETIKKTMQRFPIDMKKKTEALLRNKEKYIQNVMSQMDLADAVERRIQADWSVTRCIHARNHDILRLRRILKTLQNKWELAVTKLGKVSITENLQFAISVLCGRSVHHSTANPFFSETAYDYANVAKWAERDIDDNSSKYTSDPLIINERGRVTNILPALAKPGKSTTAWMCDGCCRKIDVDFLCEVKSLFHDAISVTYRSGQHFFTRIDECSSESSDTTKKGHPITCYIEPLSCKSRFLKMNILSYHYPFLRTVKRMIYDIKHPYCHNENIGIALQTGNLIELQRIQIETENLPVKGGSKNFEMCLDGTELTNRYMKGLKEFHKIDQDPPSIPCISCERLCTSGYVDRTEKHLIETNSKFFGLKGNPINMLLGDMQEDGRGMTWREKLQELYEPEYFKDSFICHHCIGKFKVEQLPSSCILNNLFTDEIPLEIQTLNMFEKMLVQRAKAFQVVVKLGTVQNKIIPHYMKLDQAKGRTFHLPLPFEATLEKLCKETDPIDLNHGLYVLVRSNPKKNKAIWEDYVNIRKIWIALHWLKYNNPFYVHFELPSTPEQLLSYLERTDLEYNEAPPSSRGSKLQTEVVLETEKLKDDALLAPAGTGFHLEGEHLQSTTQIRIENHLEENEGELSKRQIGSRPDGHGQRNNGFGVTSSIISDFTDSDEWNNLRNNNEKAVLTRFRYNPQPYSKCTEERAIEFIVHHIFYFLL
ncbi:hypothetical protein QAD02_021401 [Eretmocerus hayati]|uniref:Uncharacterized protein n=1 Tax=Eretmocerus hayati TaxID=131215 RepID=A0ACC2PR65_9HYME|nr:hypothetical protein QAD02_021401 [Eretmocerus hayati]